MDSHGSSTQRRNDVLDVIGSIIGYMLLIIFIILIICSGYFAFNATSTCPFVVSSAHDCLGIFGLMVAMFLLAFILVVAIALRQSALMLPWMIMSTILVIAGITYLVIFPNILLIVFGSLVLCPLILTWYPLYKLYQRYRLESEVNKDEQRLSYGLDELYTLNRTSKVAATAEVATSYTPYLGEVVRCYRTVDRRSDGGPPYDVVMTIDPNYPAYVAGSPAPGWRNGLYPKMSNKEYV